MVIAGLFCSEKLLLLCYFVLKCSIFSVKKFYFLHLSTDHSPNPGQQWGDMSEAVLHTIISDTFKVRCNPIIIEHLILLGADPKTLTPVDKHRTHFHVCVLLCFEGGLFILEFCLQSTLVLSEIVYYKGRLFPTNHL